MIMLIQKESDSNLISIKGYKPGFINVSGQSYDCGLILTPNQLTTISDEISFDKLEIGYLKNIISKETEILIIGTGEQHLFFPSNILSALNSMGIAAEAMATRQACHTFQVLSYEKRKVVALLFL
ncbi:Mth938-like domain-containing protein [Aliikangiella sp. IMCC44359]|uniref:Mth938-like domain-containing protein n=1 Tax=Aliikangiella sp. IMCC44359 TaxID=3459125 RepID=UPI00403AA9A0